jgi:hypothetical protein
MSTVAIAVASTGSAGGLAAMLAVKLRIGQRTDGGGGPRCVAPKNRLPNEERGGEK